VSTQEKVASGLIGAELGAGPAGVSGSVKLDANLSASATQKQTVTQTVQSTGTNVEHSFKDGHNRWTFTPATGPHLLGHAFRETEALMCLSLTVPFPKISPSVKIIVKCRREDIDILDFKEKKVKLGFWAKNRSPEERRKLAEEIIKTALVSSNLQVVDLEQDFVEVTIADVLASEGP